MGRSTLITTRPHEDALRDCAELSAGGISCLPAPMLEIINIDADITKADSADAIVLTSRHAAPMLAAHALIDKPCYCVGASTAASASAAGFRQVIAGPGDGEGLSAMIAADQVSSVFWASAVDTGFNLTSALAQHGITTIQEPIYKAATTSGFPEDVTAAIKADEVAAVLMHSGRAGEHFDRLMQASGVADKKAHITAIVISPRAARLCGDGWRNIIAVDPPRRSAMFAAARTVLADESYLDRGI